MNHHESPKWITDSESCIWITTVNRGWITYIESPCVNHCWITCESGWISSLFWITYRITYESHVNHLQVFESPWITLNHLWIDSRKHRWEGRRKQHDGLRKQELVRPAEHNQFDEDRASWSNLSYASWTIWYIGSHPFADGVIGTSVRILLRFELSQIVRLSLTVMPKGISGRPYQLPASFDHLPCQIISAWSWFPMKITHAPQMCRTIYVPTARQAAVDQIMTPSRSSHVLNCFVICFLQKTLIVRIFFRYDRGLSSQLPSSLYLSWSLFSTVALPWSPL